MARTHGQVFVAVTAAVCFLAAAGGVGWWLNAAPADLNDAVIEVAYGFPDGGRYDIGLYGSGVSREIIWRDQTVLPASDRGTYCCGFTFAVFMEIALSRGLLPEDYRLDQVVALQREWYGAEAEHAERQLADAMAARGLGIRVPVDELKAGDFVQFWTTGGGGHSCIFLNYQYYEGRRIGFMYRSSQPTTDGIGDELIYFDLSDLPAHARGEVDPSRTYGGRLLAR